ncbi:Sterol uptake control protein 2 [Colletotrichum sidae]|uniref:Sterol uptake control protein 2 n=1 Tax=Colletotrichum sidae TaxID=1347389 RepID=A0A4R8T1I7_9PEZI|nr:Sterol uptake control protein 2 [Colletotrichum sidae]
MQEDASARRSRMRQRTPHRKSRFGCKECKQRHVKCDETRPSCINCSTALRRCSYLDTETTLPSPAVFSYQCPSPAASTSTASSSAPAAAGGTVPLEPPGFGHVYPPTEPYDLRHMELLYHFEHELGPDMGFGDPTQPRYQRMSIKQALRTPYLMDELLALSAAHKSTLAAGAGGRQDDDDDAVFYRGEAARLQTRALSQFNLARAEVSADNLLPIFLYSTWLGQHVLFDAFTLPPGGFSAVLDKLVHCMNLHRGVRTIAAGSWATLRAHFEAHLGADSRFVDTILLDPDSVESGAECAGLLGLFAARDSSSSSGGSGGGGDLTDPARAACREAVEALQLMFDIRRTAGLTPVRRISTVQEWSVRVPTAFVSLLDQRRPEALVVLAYWGALLHYCRGYWAYAGAGRTLVRSISAHLGSYWSEWLAWPQETVEGSDVFVAAPTAAV